MWTGIDHHFSIHKHFFIQETSSNSANVSICHWFYLLEPWLLFTPFPGLLVQMEVIHWYYLLTPVVWRLILWCKTAPKKKMTKKKSIQMLKISNCLWFDILFSDLFCHLVSALERRISRYWRWQELQQPLQVAKIFFSCFFNLKAEASLEILHFSHFDYFQSTRSLSNIEICLNLLILCVLKLVK